MISLNIRSKSVGAIPVYLSGVRVNSVQHRHGDPFISTYYRNWRSFFAASIDVRINLR